MNIVVHSCVCLFCLFSFFPTCHPGTKRRIDGRDGAARRRRSCLWQSRAPSFYASARPFLFYWARQSVDNVDSATRPTGARSRDRVFIGVVAPSLLCVLAAPFLYRHNNDNLPDLSSQEYATLKEKTIEIIAAIPTRYLSADKGHAAIDALCAGRPVPVFVPFCFFCFSLCNVDDLTTARSQRTRMGVALRRGLGRGHGLSKRHCRRTGRKQAYSLAARPLRVGRAFRYLGKKQNSHAYGDGPSFFLFSVVAKGRRGRGNPFSRKQKKEDDDDETRVAVLVRPQRTRRHPQRPTGAG